MEHYLTVTMDRHGRERTTSASSSVLSQTPDNDDTVLNLPLSRSRHSVDCSGLMTERHTTSTSRSTSRLHLGVPSDLRRSSLQTDRHNHRQHSCPQHPRRSDSACDGGPCAQSSGSRSSVVLTDDEGNDGRRVSYSGTAPLRLTATVSAPRENKIFDIGADLIKVWTSLSVAVRALVGDFR